MCASLFKSYMISEKLSQLKEEGFYSKDNSSAYDFSLSLCVYNTAGVHRNSKIPNLIDRCPTVCEAECHWGWAVGVCEMVATLWNRKSLLPVASAAVLTLFPGGRDSQPRFSGTSCALCSNREQSNLVQMIILSFSSKEAAIFDIKRSS